MKRAIEILDPEEIALVLAACDPERPTGIRDRALLVVLWRAGLRISEALALKPKDLNAPACTLRVLHGKGDKARLVALDPQAMSELGSWRALWPKYGNPGSPIFCTLKGTPMNRSNVWTLLVKRVRAAGIEKRVHPHTFRHIFASELRAEGVDVAVISKALGHNSIATTCKYLDHLNPVAVLDAMKARTWNHTA